MFPWYLRGLSKTYPYLGNQLFANSTIFPEIQFKMVDGKSSDLAYS